MNTRTRKIAILDMDTRGKVTERTEFPGSEMWLDNTVAGRLYPNLKLALVTVPTGGKEWDETAQVTDGMFNVTFEGTTYRLVGSGGGAKNGKFYFADAEHAPMLHKRFQNWPEALITYFGIQTGDCKRIINSEGTVLVVPDNELGTNDCRGWISESMFARLDAPAKAFYQFRLGFALENGKGSFKVMKDDVAQAIGADIIIPESSCKPAPHLKPWSFDNRADRMFTGPLVVGFREVSRDLVFASSYTVTQHASEEVFRMEVVPKAREAMQALKDAWVAGNHEAVVRQIGKKITLDELNQEDREDEELMRTVEALLLADGSGEICQHPYVYRHLDKLMAKWAYKVLTGGGLHLPGFALADDGYLFLDENKAVVSASDWIPMEIALTGLESARSLCVRYPVRMKEDLLPMHNCDRNGAVALLMERGLFEAEAAFVADEQLFLNGTYTLHSKTAKKNGGDYDFDQICVVDEDRYPMFVQDRFDFQSTYVVTKTKAGRLKSPLYSLETVAINSLGNQIGVITDTMSSCIAYGRMKEMYVLVGELQKEIDSLKHNTRADLKVIKEIKEVAPKAPWLSLKNAESVSSLLQGNRDGCTEKGVCTCSGGHALQIEPTDKIGMMFNMLRSDLVEMMGKPMSIKQFQGLLVGHTPTQQMLEESRIVFRTYNAGQQMLRQEMEKKVAILKQAEAEFVAAKEAGLQESVKIARKNIAKARSEIKQTEAIHKTKSSNLIKIVAGWGKGKAESRREWAQAVHTVVSGGNGAGSLLFHTFPQEAVDAIAERTNGIRVKVAINKVAGVVFIKDSIFYQDAFNGGQAKPLFRFDAQKNRLAHVPVAA
jgi:hypothetical protein